MNKKQRNKYFRTKLQVFAGVAWVVMSGIHTFYSIDSSIDIKHYLIGMAIITGTCLLAWGMPFGAISHYLATGTPLKPFNIGKSKKKQVNRSKKT